MEIDACDSKCNWGSDKDVWCTGDSWACVSCFGVSMYAMRVSVYVSEHSETIAPFPRRKTDQRKARENESALPSDMSVDSADIRESDVIDPKTSGIPEELSEIDR